MSVFQLKMIVSLKLIIVNVWIITSEFNNVYVCVFQLKLIVSLKLNVNVWIITSEFNNVYVCVFQLKLIVSLKLYVNAWIITSEFNNQSIMHNMHSQGMHYTANRTLQQPVSSPGLLFKRQHHVFAAWSRHDWCGIQIQLLQ